MSQRILAASDIHGHGQALMTLLKEAHYHPGNDQLILCGDYVNKGPDSEGTLEIIQQLQAEGAIVLIGNHEVKWLEEMNEAEYAMQHHLKITYQKIQQQWGKLKWRPLLESFKRYYMTEDYLFIHAGVIPNMPLEHQSLKQITGYNRHTDFIHHYPGKIMIHGHVPTFREGMMHGEIFQTKDAINIDSGAGHGKYLTVYDVTHNQQYKMKL